MSATSRAANGWAMVPENWLNAHADHIESPVLAVLQHPLHAQHPGRAGTTRDQDDFLGQWRSSRRDGLGLGGRCDFDLQQRSSWQPHQQRGTGAADPDVSLFRTLALRSWRQEAEPGVGWLGVESDSDRRLLHESFEGD